ncbi:MAG: methyl-accepting chemotaxis protein, partial [Bacilli bacterium]
KMAERVENMMRFLTNLEDKIRSVNAVADQIKWIANQTQMLALNAGIEASRSEYANSGFGRIAIDIRSLATQATGATTEITRTLQSMRSDHNQMVVLFEQTQSETDLQSQEVLQTEAVFHNQLTTVAAFMDKLDVIHERMAEVTVQKDAWLQVLDALYATIERTEQAATEGRAMLQENLADITSLSTASESIHQEAYEVTRRLAFFKTETVVE